MFAGPGQRSFEELASAAGSASSTLFELRKFCMSLGPNVVEDIRAHRAVFGKSMAMRWFADISAENGLVIVKINEGRRTPPSVIEIKANANTQEACKAISDSYSKL